MPGSYLDKARNASLALDALSLGMSSTGIGEAVSWIPEVGKILAYDIPSIFEKPTDLGRWADLGLDALGLLPIIGLLPQGIKASRHINKITQVNRIADANRLRKQYNTVARAAKKVGRAEDLYSLLIKSPTNNYRTSKRIEALKEIRTANKYYNDSKGSNP